MTFVTRMLLESGDRAALEDVVGDIKATAERKGVAMKGPHSHPPARLTVPQLKALDAADGRTFPSWDYRVYSRELEIHGHEDFARQVAGRTYPRSLRVEVTVEQVGRLGRGRD